MLGQRIELVDEPGPGIDVWTEPVAEQDPGRRYLQARLAMLLSAHEDAPLDSTIGALIAARGLTTCWGRFCLAAAPRPAGDGWLLSTVGPDLDPPRPITLSAPPVS